MIVLIRGVAVFGMKTHFYSESWLRRCLVNKLARNFCGTGELGNGVGNRPEHEPCERKINVKISNIGKEIAGNLKKKDVNQIMNDFYDRPELQSLSSESGLDDKVFVNAKLSFKKYCGDINNLSTDLHIILHDLIAGEGHVLDLFPFFLNHAYQLNPHLKYKAELLHIGDLSDPINWYPLARQKKRKIFFHYGPTNSGKTHTALQRFYESKTGVYCAPLKLLANEIYEKANAKGVLCDLVTGEERKRVLDNDVPANHLSCTVEMLPTTNEYDVAVIDEIQMLKDQQRGYAWTRAFLGVAAKEVHLCGEESALPYVQALVENMNERFQGFKYKRLTKLFMEEAAVGSFQNIRPGDCIICFSKKDIFTVTVALEKLGVKCAVIYGNLPPGTKQIQTERFNDQSNSCNILVATDAVGLGMNLNIKRIVFYSIHKCEEVMGEKKRVQISSSLALQIAGRAGRYQSAFKEGYVTTFKEADLPGLRKLLLSHPEPVSQAGLHPTIDQIEMFSFFLPDMNLKQLLDIFETICRLDDSMFFLCDLTNFKRLAEQIKHLPLPLKTAYIFCSAPVNFLSPLVVSVFVQFAKKYSAKEAVSIAFMKKCTHWPFMKPETLKDLAKLEEAFDCLDLYLWLGNQFPLSFPDVDLVRSLQKECVIAINQGMIDLVRLIGGKQQGSKDLALEGENDVSIEDILLKKGILTRSLLKQLKNEWKSEMKKDSEKR